MNSSSFINRMHSPMLPYKCCDVKKWPPRFSYSGCFSKWKKEFYPDLCAFGWHFSLFIETHQRHSGIQKLKQFSSQLKTEVFHLERLTDTVLVFWSKINYQFSCNEALVLTLALNQFPPFFITRAAHYYLSKYFSLFHGPCSLPSLHISNHAAPPCYSPYAHADHDAPGEMQASQGAWSGGSRYGRGDKPLPEKLAWFNKLK